MTPDQPERKTDGGFTLLELLVAITLLGLVATMAFSGFHLGTRAWEVADQRGHDVYLVQQMLRERISAAYLPSELNVGTTFDEDRPPFDGGPDHVSFIAPLPDLFGVAGLYRVTVEVVASGNGGNSSALVMSWQLWRPQGEARVRQTAEPDDGARRVLLDGIEGAAFAFFGPAEAFGAGSTWQEQWQRRPGLPMLVRIDLERAQKDWPTLVIALRAGGAI